MRFVPILLLVTFSLGFSIPPVIPLPSQYKYTDEGSWNSKSGLEISDDALTTQWKSTIEGYMLESSVPSSGIPFKLNIDSALKHLGIEGYEMDAKPDGIQIRATTQTGLFYGLQTLRQFWKSGQNIDAIEIVDVPANSWRGFMLDIARNFMPLEYLKLTVDRMAILKLNRFHLHLTDDQGWRIEVKSWSKLHTVGSESSTRNNNGYLTQVEYKELDEYARLRGVILVPEIDLPGHTNAVKAAYPQFGCGSDVAWPYKNEQVGFSKLCLEKSETYDFVQEVVEEIISITSGPWFHVGGDEVADVNYKSFISWLDTIVTNKNKVMVGWQEINKGSTLSSNTIWQIWKHGTSVPSGSNPMLNSDCANAYLDHPEKIGGPGLTWCSSALLESEVYQIKPGSVGMEAALWGERLTNSSVVDDMMYPRLIAMAEASWTPDDKKNYNNFVVRRGLLEVGLFTVKAVEVPINVVVALQKSIPIFSYSVSYMDLMGRALVNKPSTGVYLERKSNGTIVRRIAN
jgi:hexosaminidase